MSSVRFPRSRPGDKASCEGTVLWKCSRLGGGGPVKESKRRQGREKAKAEANLTKAPWGQLPPGPPGNSGVEATPPELSHLQQGASFS